MFVKYKDINFQQKTLALIVIARTIIEEYEADGLILTLRQLYYQFVSRDIFANTERNYKRLASVINDARLAGLISWTAIEDRTRNLRSLPHWSSPAEIVEAAANQFRIDKWKGQDYRVEVWVEKDALIGVIERVAQELDVPCFACRGYVSASELWVAAQRLREWEEEGYKTVVLHLGDHDPSGIDMTRDIEDRLFLFDCDAEVKRIALTMSQVNALNPPPNPAKLSDSRSGEYVARFGPHSWELDALDPKFLAALVRDEVTKLRRVGKWNRKVSEEKKAKARLMTVVKQLVKEFEKKKGGKK